MHDNDQPVLLPSPGERVYLQIKSCEKWNDAIIFIGFFVVDDVYSFISAFIQLHSAFALKIKMPDNMMMKEKDIDEI